MMNSAPSLMPDGQRSRDGLDLGVELDRRGAVLVEIAEAGPLPAAEGVVGHRHRDRHVDADHAHLHAGHEVAGGVAVAGENRDAVAVFVFGRQPQRLFVVVGAHDAQHRAEDLVGVDRHVGGDVVEQGGPDEEALLQAGVIEGQLVGGALAAVDHQLGARLDALADVVAHPLERGLGDQRAVVGLRVQAVPDAQLVDALNEPVAQPICRLLADRHRDADRHAPLAGAAVTGADQCVDGLVQVGVGQDDHVVLRAAEALRALAVGGRGRVDVLRDIGAADEADGLDVGVVQDRVDGFLVAVDDLEHARAAGRPRGTVRPGAPAPTDRAQKA